MHCISKLANFCQRFLMLISMIWWCKSLLNATNRVSVCNFGPLTAISVVCVFLVLLLVVDCRLLLVACWRFCTLAGSLIECGVQVQWQLSRFSVLTNIWQLCNQITGSNLTCRLCWEIHQQNGIILLISHQRKWSDL